jgi:hypothetical protein
MRCGNSFLLATAGTPPGRAWGGTRLPEPVAAVGHNASSYAALVPMVQAAHFGERHDGAFRRRVDASRRGRGFLEGEMGSRPRDSARDASAARSE